MNDDISYYTFDNMNIYKSKYKRNILLYIICVCLFVVINIIICFINDDYLYTIITSVLWLFFVNFSVFHIYKTIILPRRAYNLYNILYFGNKKNIILTYKGDCRVISRQGLKFNEYCFTDDNGEEYKLFLYGIISFDFSTGQTYHLSLVDDLIYGGIVYERRI